LFDLFGLASLGDFLLIDEILLMVVFFYFLILSVNTQKVKVWEGDWRGEYSLSLQDFTSKV
jgi:hypothetical protein